MMAGLRDEEKEERRHVEEEDGVTFPMHPGKKRLLVRVGRQSRVEKGKIGTERRKKKVQVARKVPLGEVRLEPTKANNEDQGTVYFTDMLGRFARATSNGGPQGIAARRDENGELIPYSILGSVDDFIRITGAPSSAEIDADNRRGSSETTSSQYGGMLNAKSNETMAVESSATDSRDLNQAMQAARQRGLNEARKRSQQAELQEERMRKEKLSALRSCDQLILEREARALQNFEDWQREWTRFKLNMCRLSNKKLEDLVISRTDEYREKMEEYKVLDAATPQHEKHGSDYWMMSLRGIGARHVAVGNIFSGLFCPVKETTHKNLETIRVPRLSFLPEAEEIENEGVLVDQGWKQSSLMEKEQLRLREHIKAIRPHRVSSVDAEHLAIKGDSLLEWAYVSREKRRQAQLQLQREGAPGHTQEEEGEIQNPPIASPPGPRRGPHFHATLINRLDQGEKDDTLKEISLSSCAEKVASASIELQNTGTVALFYEFHREAIEPEETVGLTICCSHSSGALLPCEVQEVSFSFCSNKSGAWRQRWKISTKPAAEEAPISFDVCCLAKPQIHSRNERNHEIWKELEIQGSKHLEDIAVAAGAREKARQMEIEEKLPGFGLEGEELAHFKSERFEKANRALGLYFDADLEQNIEELALLIFQQFHQFDVEKEDSNPIVNAKTSLDTWLEDPSFVMLRGKIQSIADGNVLRPACRALTASEPELASVSRIEDEEEQQEEDDHAAEEEDNENDEIVEVEETEGTGEHPQIQPYIDRNAYIEDEQARLNALAANLVLKLHELAWRLSRIPVKAMPSWDVGKAVAIQLIENCSPREEESESALTPGGLVESFVEVAEQRKHAALNEFFDSRLAKLEGIGRIEGCELARKKVVIFADLSLRASHDDPAVPCDTDSPIKISPVAESLQWLFQRGPKTILLVNTEEMSSGLIQSVCEELVEASAKDIVFIENDEDEENLELLRGSECSDVEDEEDEDEDEGEEKGERTPSKIPVEEIAVFFIGSLESFGSDIVAHFSPDIWIQDSLEGALSETFLPVDGVRDLLMGPTFAAHLEALTIAISQESLLWILGDLSPTYLDASPEEEEDEDEDEDEAWEEDVATELSSEEEVDDSDICEFTQDVDLFDELLKVPSTETIVLVGNFARFCQKSIMAMGICAARLLNGVSSKPDSCDWIPSNQQEVCNFPMSEGSSKAKEAERVRSIWASARRRGVRLRLILDRSTKISSFRGCNGLRDVFSSHTHLLVAGQPQTSFLARCLLRMILSSGTECTILEPRMFDELEMIKRGDKNDDDFFSNEDNEAATSNARNIKQIPCPGALRRLLQK